MQKLLILLSFLIASRLVSAQISGTLDSTFGTNGRVVTTRFTPYANIAQSLAIQPDGKILVGGSSIGTGVLDTTTMLLVRLKTDGTRDNSFGDNGKVTTKFGASSGVINAVKMQNDGKIVVGGTSNAGFSMVRYLSNGALDVSFGSDGKVTTSIASSQSASIKAIAIQPDGKIIVAGDYTDYAQNTQANGIALVRYTANGTLDGSFNGTGILKIVAPFNSVRSVLLQENNKIIVCGLFNTFTPSTSDMVLRQFNTDGSTDAAFGVNGIVTVKNFVASAAKGSNGKIVVAGADRTTSDHAFKLCRINENGTLDNDFGTNGMTTTAIGMTSRAQDLIIQKDGNILLIGSSDLQTTSPKVALVRYTSNGTLDNTFGVNGKAAVPKVSTSEEYLSAAIQTDGKIVTCGIIIDMGVPNFAIARFNNTVSNETNIAHINEKKDPLSIFPNPAKNELNIDVKDRVNGDFSLKISDLTGRIVYQNKYDKTLINNTLKLNIGDLVSGLYLVTIQTEKEIFSQLMSKN